MWRIILSLQRNSRVVHRRYRRRIEYRGRAESWCSAQLSQDWEPVENKGWVRIDKTTGSVLAETNCIPLNGSSIPGGSELVRVLTPVHQDGTNGTT
jgi:hypothetical protein